MNNIIYTIDVEKDLHTNKYLGITEGLKQAEKIFSKNNIKPILFITADCIKKYPKIFKNLKNKGWEISLHGLSHKRFDEMSLKQKEYEIIESLRIFKKINIIPKGFRAPQHSIDNLTLDLLDNHGFEYDSSYAPLNCLQLIFFPRKFRPWINQFISKLNNYKIRKRLIEMPTSSIGLPFVSLIFRIFPLWFLKVYIRLLKVFYKNPIFYCHSWDFIEIKESRINRIFPHTLFTKKLSKLIENE